MPGLTVALIAVLGACLSKAVHFTRSWTHAPNWRWLHPRSRRRTVGAGAPSWHIKWQHNRPG